MTGRRTRARGSAADRRAGEGGFTLIEVVVAFAILALVLGTLSGAFSGLIGGAAEARRYQIAVALAESKLAELGAAAPLRPGETAGSFAGGYAWRAAIRPYRERGGGEFEGAPRLYRLAVEVSWGSLARRRVSFDTLRLATDAAGAGGAVR